MDLVRHFANRYRGLGWSVVPVAERSKLPTISWLKYQTTLPTQEEIDHWVWPNLAVVTGTISGICVIDEDSLDSLSPEDRAKTQAFLDQLPPTATSLTGKGQHRYFSLPRINVEALPEAVEARRGGGAIVDTKANALDPANAEYAVVPTRVRFLPGLDCRGEGGYALAPPSIHPSGRVYVWGEREPEDGLPELPVWALEIIRGTPNNDDDSWRDTTAGVEEGGRNNAAAKFIGRLLYKQPPEMMPFMWEAAKEWNSRNTPPLDESELYTVFKSIMKREKNSGHELATVDAVERDDTEDTLVAFNAENLLKMDLVTLPHTIGGMIPSGFATIAGKPKLGKSRLALQFALSVAAGAPPFSPLLLSAHRIDGSVQRGDVLFLALEDSPNRLRDRLRSMVGERTDLVRNITFYTSFPNLFNGGIPLLAKQIEANPNLRLIVIDTLAAFSGAGPGNTKGESAFNVEYRCVRPILDLVKGKPITVLVVQHGRKDINGGNADPFDSVAGTLGTSAVADTLMVLHQQRLKGRAPQTILAGKGRDIEGFELPLISRGPVWSIGQEQDDE